MNIPILKPNPGDNLKIIWLEGAGGAGPGVPGPNYEYSVCIHVPCRGGGVTILKAGGANCSAQEAF